MPENLTYCAGCPNLGVYYVLSRLWLHAVGGTACPIDPSLPALFRETETEKGGVRALAELCARRGEGILSSVVAIERAEDFDPAALSYLPGGAVLLLGQEGDVDPLNVAELETAVKNALSEKGASVVRVRCECVRGKRSEAAYRTNTDRCRACGACLRLGCPAISRDGRRAVIDSKKCTACALCSSLCKCGAIYKVSAPRTIG